MQVTPIVAVVVFVGIALLTIWAWRERPGAYFVSDFIALWKSGPWGKQFFLDFYGLEVVLILWMLVDAYEAGNWLAFGVCVATMPFFGVMSAATYWLIAFG